MSDLIDDLMNDALGIGIDADPEPMSRPIIGSQSRDGLIIFDPPDDATGLESGYADEKKIRPAAPGTLQLQMDGDVDLPYYQAFWVVLNPDKLSDKKYLPKWIEFDSYVVFQGFLRRMLGHDVHASEQAIALLHNFRLVDVNLETRGSFSVRGFDKVGTFL